MGKLVLFLKDASPVEIPLSKERLTIGRRADNDVCLPYPAVSGEHAAVVTILADSFLEDLGSTNGTLVNGRPIAKHFLRDRDQIDIGRQLLVYLADAEAKPEPPPSLDRRDDRRELARRVEGVKPRERMEPTLSTIDEDLGAALGARAEPRAMPEAPGTMPGGAASATGRVPTEARPDEATFDAELADIRRERASQADLDLDDEVEGERAATPSPAHRGPPVHGRVRVLSGPSAGRVVDISRDEFVVGRVGLQVAAIERRDDALWLVPREGDAPPTVNGEAVPADGRELRPGDAFAVAGTSLELAHPD